MSRVEELLAAHDKLTSAAKSIMRAKNHDYTSGSGDPFANFRGSSALGIDPVVGILLRMQDKMQRVKTFVEKGELQVKGEGVEDAIIDLINYSVLMYGLSQESRAYPGSTESGDFVEEVTDQFGNNIQFTRTAPTLERVNSDRCEKWGSDR